MKKYLLMAGVAVSFLTSCGGNKKTESTSTDGNDQTQNTVLAKVNGQTLTKEELLYQLPSEYRDQLGGKELDDAVENWINTELLSERGAKMGLEKDPEVQAVMKFRKSDAMARRYIELEILNKTTVSPKEVDSVYTAEKDQYKFNKERIRANHIMVASKDEADAIYSRLKKGDDFAKLTLDYSLDKQSAKSGGDLGYFTADQIDPDFYKAVSKLKVGEFSEPVKTPYGYHIIMLTDRQAAGASMDSLEVKNKISENLTTVRQNEAYNALLDSLRTSAKIERFTTTDTMSALGGAK